MCGLFGWLAADPRSPCAAGELYRIAELAGRRGPHAFGVAVAQHGSLRVGKQPGMIAPQLALLSWVPQAAGLQALIGQTRLATSGSYVVPANNQPLQAGNVAIAHNGNVYNWRALAEQYQLDLTTGCDSEVLAALMRYSMSVQDQPLLAHVIWALGHVDTTAPLALLVVTPDGAAAARRASPARPGHPLYRYTYSGGEYLCSRRPDPRDGTPDAALLPDNSVTAWTWDSRGRHETTAPLVAPQMGAA